MQILAQMQLDSKNSRAEMTEVSSEEARLRISLKQLQVARSPEFRKLFARHIHSAHIQSHAEEMI
jgi:hypothetical protein